MNPPESPPAKSRSTPTMDDVARHAGVSMKSVSRVLNNELHVSAKLRSKVETAIEQLGYVPDPAARSLAGARSYTIGVLFDNPSPNYTFKVQAGIYRACVDNRYHLRIDNLDTSETGPDLEGQLSRILRNGRVDGFILTPPICDNLKVLSFLEDHSIRYCRIAPFVDPDRSPGARMDDHAAAGCVADLFWSQGHRRFGIINGKAHHGAAKARFDGFVSRLHEHDPTLQIAEAYGGFDFVLGSEAGRELLALASPPTAIFATNDDSAAGAMVAIREKGLTVPEQISVCGFDDSWVATVVWPFLTTIRQPIEEMAYAAACKLIGRNPANDVETLAHQLIERASVGPAPQ